MNSSPDAWHSPAVADIAAIPGLQDLWAETLGDPRVCIAVLDGPVDPSHPCFAGAALNRLTSFFPAAAANGPAARHGTHIASVIFGRHGGPITGIAPHCRGLTAAIVGDGRGGSVAPCSPFKFARPITQAIEVAERDADAIVVNISRGPFLPSGAIRPLLSDVVRIYADTNVLMVAATGRQRLPVRND
jgi:subtilisin family serine protease